MIVNGKEVKRRKVDALAAAALTGKGVGATLANIYASRGVTPETLDPTYDILPKKETLEGCMEAGLILAEAVINAPPVTVVGDYDSDGSTASAVILKAFRQAGGKIDFIVPNRITQGYGLSPEISRMVHERGSRVLVTVDNGVASIAGVAEAKRLGLSVLISDHHLQGDELPKADCIVNPNLKGSRFASRALAGVGVAFYVMGAMRECLQKRNWEKLPNLGSLLDLVAVGTVGDLVPLDSTNRALVKMGMDRIRTGKASPGIAALLQVSGKNPAAACAETAGFVLAPRINAAGRLETADIGILMLSSDNIGDALIGAHELNQINMKRRLMQKEMNELATETIEALAANQGNAITVYDETFHEGVVGLVASHMKEKYHRPSGAFARAEDGNLKGSFRSIPGVHVRDVIDLISKRSPGLVVKFGGHAMAAGATIVANGLDRFQHAFEAAVQELAAPDAFNAFIETDGEISPREIGAPLAETIVSENWGQAFPAPLFEGDFQVVEQRPVGTEHTKLMLNYGAGQIDGIFFKRKDPVPERVHALYRLDINEFRGVRKAQIVVEGIAE